MQYILLFGVTIIIFIIAVARQTIIPLLLSTLTWLALAYVTWIVSDPTSGLTQGTSIFSFAMFFVMFMVTLKSVFDSLREQAEQRKHNIEEEIM